jgi:4-diphosphocytidyl-2-C-methyl-D-erythritol kinase
MTGGAHTARILAFAKINLDLRVLYRRADNYHELRTIFQTISLADRIQIAFTPARKTSIVVRGNVDIADNLIARAADACMGAMRCTGRVEFDFDKRIPMGAGLGGGSSDAAAVLLALPVLAGKRLDWPTLLELGAELGSDVPFFLLGGTAVAIGRGTELYPLPDNPPARGLVVAPEIHVSTADAYRRLSAELTTESQQNKMVSFQSAVWRGSVPGLREAETSHGQNDFETVVFSRYPELKSIKRRLLKLGAKPALMSGSGSALFGLFSERDQVQRAIQSLRGERTFPITLVSRGKYRSEWWKRLRAHTKENLWPPQSRYAR